jgi:hypothetical protein
MNDSFPPERRRPRLGERNDGLGAFLLVPAAEAERPVSASKAVLAVMVDDGDFRGRL